MTMTFLMLAALTIQIDLSSMMHATSAPQAGASSTPTATCHIATVSYRFVGDPGTEFKYAGESWRVPTSGSIELLADRHATEYQIAGSARSLEVWPRDAFGTRTVPLPRAH